LTVLLCSSPDWVAADLRLLAAALVMAVYNAAAARKLAELLQKDILFWH
jgi:hypothetical protein